MYVKAGRALHAVLQRQRYLSGAAKQMDAHWAFPARGVAAIEQEDR